MAELIEAVELGEIADLVSGADLIARTLPQAETTNAMAKTKPKPKPKPKPKMKTIAEKKEKKGQQKFQRIKEPKTITAYWRSKDKNLEYFPYTSDGNAGSTLIFDEKGAALREVDEAPVKLFDLPIYTSINREDIDILWANRQSEFEAIYETIEKAKGSLRNALSAFKAGAGTAREVVIANQLVADEEAKLVAIRSPKRWVIPLANPTTNTIDLKQKYEVRKLGFDAYQLKQLVLDPQSLLRKVLPQEADGVSVKQGGGGFSYGIITDDSLLGLHWPADIKVGNTQYFTAFQAILGEAVRKTEDNDLFQSILRTRSSRTLRTLTNTLTATSYTPETLQTVIIAFAKQYPEFRELLLKTGDEQLVYANVLDTIFSVGLDQDDPNIQNAIEWRGENLWGEALERARTEFREKNVTSKPEDEAIPDEKEVEFAVISKEQQDSNRKAAIINARRFQKRH